MGKNNYVSAYDALQWTKKVLKAGYTEFMMRDLPEKLHINKYLRKALAKGYIQSIGEKRISGTYLKVYVVNSCIMDVSTSQCRMKRR